MKAKVWQLRAMVASFELWYRDDHHLIGGHHAFQKAIIDIFAAF